MPSTISFRTEGLKCIGINNIHCLNFTTWVSKATPRSGRYSNLQSSCHFMGKPFLLPGYSPGGWVVRATYPHPQAYTRIQLRSMACCKNIVFAGTLFRSLLRCAFYPLQARILLNFANSSRLNGTQTRELPFGTFILAECVPKNARRRDSRKVLPAYISTIIIMTCLSNGLSSMLASSAVSRREGVATVFPSATDII